MKAKFYLTLLIAIIALSACKKDHKPITISKPKHDTAVYIVGFDAFNTLDSTIACYWKNGVITKLATMNSYAFAVAAKDSNIYIVGYTSIFPSAPDNAAYWKNGKINYLPNGSIGSRACAITLSGNDVYIAGDLEKNAVSGQAAYWKNGVLTTLTDTATRSYTTGIAVSGNDVYVSGKLFSPTGNSTPVYWKNGVMTKLDNESAFANATAVAVNGNDVYIAYYTATSGDLIGYYWKNGSVTQLVNSRQPPIITTDITINNNDVYITGFVSVVPPGRSIATYWKNNVPQLLFITGDSDGYNSHIANQVIVFQNNIYTVGYYTLPPTGITNAYYWKNGTPIKLSNDYSYANGAVGVAY